MWLSVTLPHTEHFCAGESSIVDGDIVTAWSEQKLPHSKHRSNDDTFQVWGKCAMIVSHPMFTSLIILPYSTQTTQQIPITTGISSEL